MTTLERVTLALLIVVPFLIGTVVGSIIERTGRPGPGPDLAKTYRETANTFHNIAKSCLDENEELRQDIRGWKYLCSYRDADIKDFNGRMPR